MLSLDQIAKIRRAVESVSLTYSSMTNVEIEELFTDVLEDSEATFKDFREFARLFKSWHDYQIEQIADYNSMYN